MRKEQFHITGMTCSACSSRVEGCVVKLPGVKDVSVNLLKNSMVVSYDEAWRCVSPTMRKEGLSFSPVRPKKCFASTGTSKRKKKIESVS